MTDQMPAYKTSADATFRDLLKREVAKARNFGMSDDEISLALAGAMVAVKSDAYRTK